MRFGDWTMQGGGVAAWADEAWDITGKDSPLWDMDDHNLEGRVGVWVKEHHDPDALPLAILIANPADNGEDREHAAAYLSIEDAIALMTQIAAGIQLAKEKARGS